MGGQYLQQDRVAPEQLQLVHLGEREGHHGVVIVDGVLDQQSVGLVLFVEDGGG